LTLQQHLNFTVGKGAEFDIPEPLVDLQTATRESKAKLHSRRAQPDVKAGKAAIVEKHASRATTRLKNPATTVKRTATKATKATKATTLSPQITLDF
jgi:deoxyribodipyrimidine photo-lyase